MNETEILEELKKSPYLRASLEDLIKIIKNREGETTIADVAEERIIENFRNLGSNALQDWANQESERASEHCKKKMPGIHKEVKKK